MQFVWKSIGETSEHAVNRSRSSTVSIPYPLDIMAQGVLPTRPVTAVSQTYRCNAVLGVATTSGDVLGTLTDTCMPVSDNNISRFIRELSCFGTCGPPVTQTLRIYRRVALSDVLDAPPSKERKAIVANWKNLSCKGLSVIKIELTGVHTNPRELVNRISVQLGIPAHTFRVTRVKVEL